MKLKGSIIYIGRSGSGKTKHMLKYVKRHKDKKVYVLNDKSNLSKKHKFVSVDWNFNFSSLRNSILMVEDLVCLSSKQLALLSTMVNVFQRHNQNICLLATHALRGNNIFSLTQYMSYFVFTTGHANEVNWNIVCNIYKVPDDVKCKGQMFFRNPPGQFSSLILNAESLNFEILDSRYQPILAKSSSELTKNSILQRFTVIFKPFENGGKMLSFASFILDNLDISQIDPDLSIVVKHKSKRRIKVSLIDYINVLSSSASPKISKTLLLFHKLMLSKMSIPQLFIANKNVISVL